MDSFRSFYLSVSTLLTDKTNQRKREEWDTYRKSLG